MVLKLEKHKSNNAITVRRRRRHNATTQRTCASCGDTAQDQVYQQISIEIELMTHLILTKSFLRLRRAVVTSTPSDSMSRVNFLSTFLIHLRLITSVMHMILYRTSGKTFHEYFRMVCSMIIPFAFRLLPIYKDDFLRPPKISKPVTLLRLGKQ